MKKGKLFLSGIAFVAIATMSSCSDSHDHVECHECHIAYQTANGEVEVEIGEFCGTALEEAEAPSYTYTLDLDVIVGNDTIPAGTYGDGNMEIHCEEHADH